MIKFHLPDFAHLATLNKYTIFMLDTNREIFNENIEIGSVYGTFPSAIWNGGRVMANGVYLMQEIEAAVDYYKHYNIPLRFTWTNSALEEKHLYDTYCNLITSLADNGRNEILTNSEILEKYLRDKYPNYKYISSTTKVIKDIDKVNLELDKDYFLVVLDYSINNKWDLLKQIKKPEKCEILVNAVCPQTCPVRAQHYLQISKDQLNFSKENSFDCPYAPLQMDLKEIYHKTDFVSYESIINDYVPMGFKNFKIEGRTVADYIVIDYYAHYLIKPEYQEKFIKDYLVTMYPQGI